MKGLLTKDFRILAGQKRYFTIIILIALIFLCSGQPAQIIVGYCTMFGMLFTVNTISYDEFDHGYLFLFTLPVTRKDYVLEKYVFMLLCGGGFWAVSAAAGFVADYIRGPQTPQSKSRKRNFCAFGLFLLFFQRTCASLPVK